MGWLAGDEGAMAAGCDCDTAMAGRRELGHHMAPTFNPPVSSLCRLYII